MRRKSFVILLLVIALVLLAEICVSAATVVPAAEMEVVRGGCSGSGGCNVNMKCGSTSPDGCGFDCPNGMQDCYATAKMSTRLNRCVVGGVYGTCSMDILNRRYYCAYVFPCYCDGTGSEAECHIDAKTWEEQSAEDEDGKWYDCQVA